MTQHSNPQCCPLCGMANSCALAAGSDAPCWCTQLSQQTPLAPLLPPDLPAQCICPACAQRLLQSRQSQP